MKRKAIVLFLLLSIGFAGFSQKNRWTNTKAEIWAKETGWLRGCNFIPSSAINQLEAWQVESFDTVTINRELGWAQGIGMNVMRVFLHHLAWQVDQKGFKERMDTYLKIADRHGIKTVFVFFDDCWNPTYQAGKQPAPKTGVWSLNLMELNKFQVENSDVITYHSYEAPEKHQAAIDSLKKWNRPLVCTEYMARRNNSLFTNIMPLLKGNKVGAVNWGLVAGKTNTKYAWDEPIKDGSEPKLWFHEIFRPDGTPYKQSEVDLIKSLTLDK